jgi:hypothetical protein
MSNWTPTGHKNWSNYNRALKQRGSLSIWFDAEKAWAAMPSGKRGRQQAYSDAAIPTCLMSKVLFDLHLRQATGFVESLRELVGLDWTGRYQTSAPCVGGKRRCPLLFHTKDHPGPLHLLIDCTGIKAPAEGALSAASCGCACLVINGMRANMVALNVAFGAKHTSIARQA